MGLEQPQAPASVEAASAAAPIRADTTLRGQPFQGEPGPQQPLFYRRLIEHRVERFRELGMAELPAWPVNVDRSTVENDPDRFPAADVEPRCSSRRSHPMCYRRAGAGT